MTYYISFIKMISKYILFQTIHCLLINITQAHKNTFSNNTPFHFFSKYDQNTSQYMISIPKYDPIYANSRYIGGSRYELNLNKTNLYTFIQQLISAACYIMTNYNLISSSRTAQKIMKNLQNGIDIDSIHEFKEYIFNLKNIIISESQLFLHFFYDHITAQSFSIYKLMKSPLDDVIKNITNLFLDKSSNDDFGKSLPDGSLIQKQVIFNKHLKFFLLDFKDLYNVYKKGGDCTFIYDENGQQLQISDIHENQINDFYGAVIDDVNRLYNKIFYGANENSYQLFMSSYDIHNKFTSDFKQNKILLTGEESINHFLNRNDCKSFLDNILNVTIEPQIENDEILVMSDSILMEIAIEGRGLNSNSKFDLFGMQTYANSVSDDGSSCIYSMNRLKEINSKINSFIENSIVKIECDSSWKFGDFSENNFVQATFDYYKTKKTINRNLTSLFYAKINELKDDILNVFDMDELPTTPLGIMSLMKKLLSLNITKFNDLYNQYNDVIESEEKINEGKKLLNLVNFYLKTNKMYSDEKIHGIIVNKYDIDKIEISEILIEVP